MLDCNLSAGRKFSYRLFDFIGLAYRRQTCCVLEYRNPGFEGLRKRPGTIEGYVTTKEFSGHLFAPSHRNRI